jgi:hypothetical protein
MQHVLSSAIKFAAVDGTGLSICNMRLKHFLNSTTALSVHRRHCGKKPKLLAALSIAQNLSVNRQRCSVTHVFLRSVRASYFHFEPTNQLNNQINPRSRVLCEQLVKTQKQKFHRRVPNSPPRVPVPRKRFV